VLRAVLLLLTLAPESIRMRKYLTEFIGTFFLVLTIGCTTIPGAPGVVAPLAIGVGLMGMIYAGAHVSGAHYNPAVTLGVWMRGRAAASDLIPYSISQIAGALAAAFVAIFLVGLPSHPPMTPAAGPALVAEFLFTFALVYVILNVATAKSTSGNGFYGLAIGMTVMGGTFAVAGVSGAVFNPAVAVGITTMGLLSANSIWIPVVADFAGGAAAAVVFKTINAQDT
jgi:aquaporin Z